MTEKRIIIYYQTLVDLTSLINLIKDNTNTIITDVTLASIHFGYNNDSTPYIHLNNNPPSDKSFESVYKNLNLIKSVSKNSVKINLLIGGAGTAFNQLFSNYDLFYNLLKDTVTELGFIDGFNLDIEEDVKLEDIIKLVNNLKLDFPEKKIIFAPLAGSLSSDEPGMGGFSYKELNNKIGDKVDYYNAQCYGEYSKELLDEIVKNGYPANKIVMGMLSSQDIHNIVNEVEKIVLNYPNFGGVAVWEYFNAPPSSPEYPYVWCEIMSNILYNEKIIKQN
jgi:hypothetical protein